MSPRPGCVRALAASALSLFACTFNSHTAAGGPAGVDWTTTTSESTGVLTVADVTVGSTGPDGVDTTSASEPGGGSTDEGAADEGSTGGPPAKLDDDGLLVRYYLDEAARGQSRDLARDAAARPLHLSHNWVGELAYATEQPGRTGLRWQDVGVDGGPAAIIDATKLAGLHGRTAVTFEVVADIEASAGSSHIVVFGRGPKEGPTEIGLGLLTFGSGTLIVRSRNEVVGHWFVDLPSSGRTVFHAVLDTTAPEDDRVRVYAGGVRLSGERHDDWPEGGETIELHAESELMLGNRPGDLASSFDGTLYYAAIYAKPLDEEQIAEHVGVLVSSDDAP